MTAADPSTVRARTGGSLSGEGRVVNGETSKARPVPQCTYRGNAPHFTTNTAISYYATLASDCELHSEIGVESVCVAVRRNTQAYGGVYRDD